MTRVVLSLGSNLGDSKEIVRRTIALLSEGLENLQASDLIETAPWGNLDQPTFINAVVIGEWHDSAPDLLAFLIKLESAAGRVRVERWGPRTLDLDIILFGDEISADEMLTLPHPHAHERLFVLKPWHQLDPHAQIPGKGLVSELIKKIELDS